MNNIFKTFIHKVYQLPPVQQTTRTVIYESTEKAIVVFQWKKSNGLPNHTHYGNCIFQVLRGKLLEKRGNLHNILYVHDIGKIGKNFDHEIEPLTDATSIHVYMPPPPKKYS